MDYIRTSRALKISWELGHLGLVAEPKSDLIQLRFASDQRVASSQCSTRCGLPRGDAVVVTAQTLVFDEKGVPLIKSKRY